MNIPLAHFPSRRSRVGFHYYPDTIHYQEKDLQRWLPEFNNLGVSWIVVQSTLERAIPENFIKELLRAGIEPIVQFNLSISNPPDESEINTLLEVYSRWGVHSVLLFDRPNVRSSWKADQWAQQELVERFLDRTNPLTNLALQKGLIPIFPALEPGGSFWDTSFLRLTLESLERRKQNNLLQNLVLSAYAWTGNHSLNWGFGGPSCWPNAHPYDGNADQQDQRGFRIFDWYDAICQAVLQRSIPIILLQTGISNPTLNKSIDSPQAHAQINLNITRLLWGEDVSNPDDLASRLQPIPESVIACNFWLLAAEADSAFKDQAWFKADNSELPVVQALKSWVEESSSLESAKFVSIDSEGKSLHPIRHYLLLPSYEWGIADWHLDVIRPFVKKHRPTVGFSLREAELAEHVTVIGYVQNFSEDAMNRLRNAGCVVDQIDGDGTSIASKLTER